MKILPLSPHALQAGLPENRIPWENSSAVPARFKHGDVRHYPQPRALKALELALHITAGDYHIYLSGENNLGRSHMLRDFLEPRARKSPTPPDIVYVNNFADPDKPLLLALPAGQGGKLKKSLADVLLRVRKEVPGRFEADSYMECRAGLMDKFQKA